MRSLKFAFRTLFKTPFVTIIAIVSLALGIGANAAMFSTFHQMLLESLNVPRPAELVNLSAPGPKPGSQSCGQAGTCDEVFSYAMFRDLQKVQTVFTGIALHQASARTSRSTNRRWPGRASSCPATISRSSRSSPSLGRLFDSNDDRLVGEAPVAVLSHAFWTKQFAGDAGVLNKTMRINGTTLTVVGVAPGGIRRDDDGREAAGVRADHAEGPDEPGLERLERPHQLLGLPVRAAASGRRRSKRPASRSTRSIARSSTTSRRRCSRA